MHTAFKDFFYIDTRSLNLFRLLLSAVVIIDLLTRFTDITAHYSDQGVLPLSLLFSRYWGQWSWSLAVISNNVVFIYGLFIATIAAACLLFAGYKTRLMTIVCWVGLLSIQNRNPVLYQGGDDLLLMLLFWSVFLPLRTVTNRRAPMKINNVATMAILCQVLFGMFFSGLFKGRTEWWDEGSAIYYALSLDQVARHPGLWLSRHYPITVFLTRCIYLTEVLLLPLFLMPFSRETIRMIIAAAFTLMFTGIMLCMMIGVFPLCYIAAAALFLPATLWNSIEKIKCSEMLGPSLKWLQHLLMGKSSAAHYNLHWVGQSVLGFMFTLIVLWNIATLPASPIHFPYGLNPLMYSLRLNQSWGMFAPTVLKEDGWLVCKAELNDNTQIDLNAADLQLSFDKPAYVLSRYPNDRWRKYTEQLFVGANTGLRPAFAHYLVNKWDRSQESEHKKVKNLSVIFMLEVSRPFNVPGKLEQIALYETGIPAKK